MRMTTDEVFHQFRRMPEMKDFVEKCYLDEDLARASERFYYSEEFQAVRQIALENSLRTPGMILDLGGGNGVASLAWRRAGYDVVLLEPNRGPVAGLGATASAVKRGVPGLSLLAGAGEALPFPAQTFDLVYARQVLHHVRDLEQVCSEVSRVLAPRGLFFATREHVIDSRQDLHAFLENHPTHRFTGDENARTLYEYCRAFRAAGFRRTKVIGYWQSVINYYPESVSTFLDLCRAALSRRLGASLADILVTRPLVVALCGWYMTRHDHCPGRMYSFVACR